VTSWRADLAPGTRARLRIVKRDGSSVTARAASDWVTADGGAQSFKTHLAVTEYGARIAVDVQGGGLRAAADDEHGVLRIEPALGDGETRAGTRSAHEPFIQATTEPDADGDGRGDVTEDDCVYGCTPAGTPPATPLDAGPHPDHDVDVDVRRGFGRDLGHASGDRAKARLPGRPARSPARRRAGRTGLVRRLRPQRQRSELRRVDRRQGRRAQGRRRRGRRPRGRRRHEGRGAPRRQGAPALKRTGKVKLTLEGTATLVNGTSTRCARR
jgi:hypothetical protein